MSYQAKTRTETTLQRFIFKTAFKNTNSEFKVLHYYGIRTVARKKKLTNQPTKGNVKTRANNVQIATLGRSKSKKNSAEKR